MKKIYPLLFVFLGLFVSAQKTPVKTDSIYTMVEENAEFPGGIIEFRKAITNGFDASKIRGRGSLSCEATFVIDREGKISDIQYTGNASLGKEIVRTLSTIKTRWRPAKINGEPVKSMFRFPITMNFQ